MDLSMLLRYGISILVFFTLMINYNRMKIVAKNRLLIFFLAVLLVLADIIIKRILGNENIFATIISSIIYPLNMSIFIYLILSTKHGEWILNIVRHKIKNINFGVLVQLLNKARYILFNNILLTETLDNFV